MDKFNYYVIHCKDNNIRFNNIKNMEKKLAKEINIYFGIKGNEIKNLNIYDSEIKIQKQFNLIGQLGCFFSHYLLIKSLIYSEYDYTVIFEDDFNILIDNLDIQINNILNNIDIDFDFLFLGTQSKQFGEIYKDNLYYINQTEKTWGFQGYIINNKNINKILTFLKTINYEVDIQIFKHIKNNDLIGLFVNPIFITQNTNCISIIRPPVSQNIVFNKIIPLNKPLKNRKIISGPKCQIKKK